MPTSINSAIKCDFYEAEEYSVALPIYVLMNRSFYPRGLFTVTKKIEFLAVIATMLEYII